MILHGPTISDSLAAGVIYCMPNYLRFTMQPFFVGLVSDGEFIERCVILDMGLILSAAAPSIPWVIFAFVFMLVFRNPLSQVMERLEKLRTPWGELSLIKQDVSDAMAARPSSTPRHTLDDLERQLNSAEKLVHGTAILWIDDNPLNNVRERRALRRSGATVHIAVSDSEAEEYLAKERYDLIISDIARYGAEKAGIEFMNLCRDKGNLTPWVFYVGKVEGPPPARSNGIVDSPIDLMYRVTEILICINA